MIKIKELEEHFGKSFDEILKDNDICYIADNSSLAYSNYWNNELFLYCNTEEEKQEMKQYLYNIKDDFMNWLDKECNSNDLLGEYEVDYYKRHFKLENGKIYFLNSYI